MAPDLNPLVKSLSLISSLLLLSSLFFSFPSPHPLLSSPFPSHSLSLSVCICVCVSVCHGLITIVKTLSASALSLLRTWLRDLGHDSKILEEPKPRSRLV